MEHKWLRGQQRREQSRNLDDYNGQKTSGKLIQKEELQRGEKKSEFRSLETGEK